MNDGDKEGIQGWAIAQGALTSVSMQVTGRFRNIKESLTLHAILYLGQ